MNTITTHAAYIAHLVSNGRHAGLAKAMVTEFFWSSINGPENDLLYSGSDEETPCSLEPAQALAEFDAIVHDYNAAVTEDGIMFDGELMFDLDGEYATSGSGNASIVRGYENGGNFN